MAQTFDTQTRKQRALLDHLDATLNASVETLRGHVRLMNVIAGTPQPRIIGGHTVIFVPGIYFIEDAGYRGLFRVDLTDNSTHMVSNDRDTHGEQWIVDDAGKLVAEASYYEQEKHWRMDIFPDGQAKTVLDIAAPIQDPQIEGLNEDASAVVVGLPQADGTTQFQQIGLSDGGTKPWPRDMSNIDGLMTSARSGRVIGAAESVDKHAYVFFDPRSDTVWRSAKSAFPNATDVDLESWSDDRNRVVLHVVGEVYGDGFYVVDMTTHKADPFGAEYDAIDAVAPVRWIAYKAADGRDLNAYLTLPRAMEAKNLPLIVLPHGGPHARDEPGFDWLSQALASQGYLVLQPEFRGSDGFGTDLLDAGFGQFGRKMQTDLSDGVRALVAQGLADPKRVCIVGASYGGYAALAGATLDDGIYRCAVSIAGLSDLKAQLDYWHWPSSPLDGRSNRFWERFLGVDGVDDPRLAEISPVQHVSKVTIPILLIHGRDDTVVPLQQSSEMNAALKAARKPVTLVTLAGEDHWLSNSETRLQMLQATVKFLEENNPSR